MPGLSVLRQFVRFLDRLHVRKLALKVVRIHDLPAQLPNDLVALVGGESLCNPWMPNQTQLIGKLAPLPKMSKILQKLLRVWRAPLRAFLHKNARCELVCESRTVPLSHDQCANHPHIMQKSGWTSSWVAYNNIISQVSCRRLGVANWQVCMYMN